jgi:hypothetical protein
MFSYIMNETPAAENKCRGGCRSSGGKSSAISRRQLSRHSCNSWRRISEISVKARIIVASRGGEMVKMKIVIKRRNKRMAEAENILQ